MIIERKPYQSDSSSKADRRPGTKKYVTGKMQIQDSPNYEKYLFEYNVGMYAKNSKNFSPDRFEATTEKKDKPPVKEPPNAPKKPPVKEPEQSPEVPPYPPKPPVEDPPGEPDKPPVKEPPGKERKRKTPWRTNKGNVR